jgi:hypothetical protein
MVNIKENKKISDHWCSFERQRQDMPRTVTTGGVLSAYLVYFVEQYPPTYVNQYRLSNELQESWL